MNILKEIKSIALSGVVSLVGLSSFAFVGGLCTSCASSSKTINTTSSVDLVEYVNPLMGTESKHSFSAGNTYPAIAMPWGMNFWTPQTGANGDGWAYSYTADKIRGLKQTHQPSPWINDYGEFSIMPVTVEGAFDQESRESWFTHKTEIAKPYYYQVYLADHDVVAELTPTERAAIIRLTYPDRPMSYFVADAYEKGSYVKIIPEKNAIVGYTTRNCGGVPENFKNWFVIISDTPFEFMKTMSGKKLKDRLELASEHSSAVVGFKTEKGQQVNLKVASSFISEAQAWQNLSELAGKDFDQVKKEGKARWNEVLSRISAKDGNIDNLRTFYSCLYRSLLFPRDLSELTKDGKRVHYSPYDGNVHDGYMFADTGFWDTFRSLFPLLNLVYPDQASKMQEGFANIYKESGFLPEWSSPGHRGCMVGNNSASVVADAYLKNIVRYADNDIKKEWNNISETLWEAVTHGAHNVHPTVSSSGRLGWQFYDELGYVPCNVGINESAARTLEYAYDDWCIYQFGKAMNKSETTVKPYAKAAMNYENLFDKEYCLMAGRRDNGMFDRPFNPLKWGGDFTEGNSLHYTWSVFHDPAGLMSLMGGRDKFEAQLDTVFTTPPIFDDSYYGFVIHEIREMQVMNMGNYAHGNQPVQHMIYLYDWCERPWKTQKYVREVMDKFYSATPDGYCGDEDNGQTSAWYVFSGLGFYPVCPCSGEYAIGTPIFDSVELTLPDGNKINISSTNNSKHNYFVQGVTVDGKAYTKNYFKYTELVKGVNINFTMDSYPNEHRGIAQEDKPYSFSDKD